ncbi:MAG: hypothetical protein IIV71_01320 [Bacteroidaceae bacterium]|nr:hypothetical protein [Bacteroidaceae bacterium]
MGRKDNKDLAWGEVFAFLGITLPLYCILAPKHFRNDLIEYTAKFLVGSILGLIILGVLYFVYLLIKDELDKKRYKKAIEEEDKRIRLANEMANRNKEKRED